MKPVAKGNIAMFVSKTFSGLNENALRYLLPRWMSAYSGVVMRLVFGTLFFWVASKVDPEARRQRSSAGMKLALFAVGAVCMFGYMFALLQGLSYTTPISSSIFISMEPVWVFLICVIFLHDRVTWMKITGILLGLGGAFIIIMTQKSSDVASNPMLGNIYCLASSLLYAIYLVLQKQFLKHTDMYTVNRWAFLGGACVAAISILFTGWDASVLHQSLFSTPMLVLLFVLIFPSAVSYLLLSIGLRNLSATVVAIYGYLILIVATIVSYILGQDHFDWWQMLSIVMIVASVYFVEIANAKTSSSPTGK
ncbi:MAG: EamA family transporter [Bacteroides sp.]|nr:EamA family transporter [Bacteroides sp.]MDE6039258.1 DMT family transporter [Paramuribaculum sp.]